MSVEQPPAIATAATQSPIAPTPIPPDATEEQLIELWLHGKSPNTIRAYRRDIAAFRAFIGKPIRLAYLGDLQRYADALTGSPASSARRLLVVKSLLSFAARMGFTSFNIGAAIRPPRLSNRRLQATVLG
jgi:integrase/recombinase XerD